MAHRKAAITMAVGIISVLFAVLFIIIPGLIMGWCNFNECTYTTSYLFQNILFAIGAGLIIIGLICGGAKDDASLGADE